MLAGPQQLEPLLAWRERYEHCLNAVVLFGDQHVQAAAEALHLLVAAVNKDTGGRALQADRAVSARFEELGPDIAQQFRVVVAAMRNDIAPDAAAIDPS